MTSKSSIKYIIKLSIPIFFANLAIPLVAIVDTGLMGNLNNASYLVATSIAASVFSMIFWSFGFLRMGTVGMVAQAYGSKDYQEIINIFLRNISFVIIISLLLIIFQRYIFQISLSIFELSLETKKYFKDYFNLRIYSSIHAGVRASQGSFSLPFDGWLYKNGKKLSIESATVAGDIKYLLKNIVNIESSQEVTTSGISPHIWVDELSITGDA